MFGEVPYKSYTFLGMGPGRGGIEHLNNTTISFDGNTLKPEDSRKRMLSFIAHEYFHHYNVKRIRPYELGPFEYDRENRTNQLWVSEGLTVYYEYLLLRRAGLIDENDLLGLLAGDINAYENDRERIFQSLQEASYYTWEEGPFGTRGGDADSSISYYKKLQRGFTDAEFQQACETVAGTHLTELFGYIYTTNGLDYEKYLGYAGLQLEPQPSSREGSTENSTIKLTRKKELDQLQEEIFQSWQEK